MNAIKDWLGVIFSWVAVFCIGAVHVISDNSAFLTGLAAIVAMCFTLWQWRKAAKKGHRKYE
jgi:hypothetical protein